MKKQVYWFPLIMFFGLLIALAIPANASAQQSYRFSVDKEVVHVYWNSDGTESIEYAFTFTNQPGAHVIDFVDIGLPNRKYKTIRADVNGISVSTSSDYQGSGFGIAVDLKGDAIQAGQSGVIHVSVKDVGNVLYADEKDKNYASAVFAPTYFGSQYVIGNTDLTVTFHFPPGVKPEEPRWHNAPSGFPSQPQAGLDDEGRITYTWQNTNANAYIQYRFGASFPKTYILANAIVLPTPIPTRRIITTQTSPLTSKQPLISANALSYLVYYVIGGLFLYIFIGIPFLNGLGIPTTNGLPNIRRKLQYISPKISIEGHGIKRGLTAVEAAILMEEPLEKVMTMILFGVIKKGVAQVTKRDPLEIKASDSLPDSLYQYEIDFIKAFKTISAWARKNGLQTMMVALINSVSEKMRGFSLNETIDYYKSLTEKAWQQVEEANTPEVKGQKLDEELEWMMIDRNYDHRTRHILTEPIYLPAWWDRYDPGWRSSTTQGSFSLPPSQEVSSSTVFSPSREITPPQSTKSISSSSALPGADFAASIINGVQIFSQKIIGDVTDFTKGVTNVTNPLPSEPSWLESISKSSDNDSNDRHSGGNDSECACACACAGCACACAGDGR